MPFPVEALSGKYYQSGPGISGMGADGVETESLDAGMAADGLERGLRTMSIVRAVNSTALKALI